MKFNIKRVFGDWDGFVVALTTVILLLAGSVYALHKYTEYEQKELKEWNTVAIGVYRECMGTSKAPDTSTISSDHATCKYITEIVMREYDNDNRMREVLRNRFINRKPVGNYVRM